MKRITSIFLFFLLFTSLSFAQFPHLISYQGKVTSLAGVGFTNTINITFRVYDDENWGTLKWEETQVDVPVIKGLFDVQLGSVNPINLSFDEEYWLEIEMPGEDILDPRVKLTSSPYAYRTLYADSVAAGGGDSDWDWQVVGSNMYSLVSGNVGIGTVSPWQ